MPTFTKPLITDLTGFRGLTSFKQGFDPGKVKVQSGGIVTIYEVDYTAEANTVYSVTHGDSNVIDGLTWIVINNGGQLGTLNMVNGSGLEFAYAGVAGTMDLGRNDKVGGIYCTLNTISGLELYNPDWLVRVYVVLTYTLANDDQDQFGIGMYNEDIAASGAFGYSVLSGQHNAGASQYTLPFRERLGNSSYYAATVPQKDCLFAEMCGTNVNVGYGAASGGEPPAVTSMTTQLIGGDSVSSNAFTTTRTGNNNVVSLHGRPVNTDGDFKVTISYLRIDTVTDWNF